MEKEKLIAVPDSGGYAALFCQCGRILGFVSPAKTFELKCSSCGITYAYGDIRQRAVPTSGQVIVKEK